MTREEAIRLLSGLMFKGKLKEALDMAIKALEQEPILDKIRAEIEMKKLEDSPNFCVKAHNNAVDRILQIIDEYKADSNS